jgi:hypothetical protein
MILNCLATLEGQAESLMRRQTVEAAFYRRQK